METTLGLILLGLYAATFVPLLRWFRSPAKPAWLQRSINAEYVLLLHVMVLITGIALTIDGLMSGAEAPDGSAGAALDGAAAGDQ